MDDQVAIQQPASQPASPSLGGPVVSPPDDQAQQPLAPPAQVPSGSMQKEALPTPVSEFVKPSEIAPDLHPEVVEAGVEAQHENKALPQQADTLGIKVMHEATPVLTEPTGAVKLPMPQSDAARIAKTGKPTDARTWNAVQIVREYLKLAFKKKGSI